MSQFDVTLLYDCTETFYGVQAATPDEATDKAEMQAQGRLCHQCSDHLELGDVIKTIVVDADGKEVGGWDPLAPKAPRRVIRKPRVITDEQVKTALQRRGVTINYIGTRLDNQKATIMGSQHLSLIADVVREIAGAVPPPAAE